MDSFLGKLMSSAPKVIAAAGKNSRTLSALGILAVCVVAVAYFHTHPGISQTVGNDSVVMGQVSPSARVGDRSVVIGATDAHGNTILAPMVVGHNAHGGPNSVVIGADAGGGQTSVTPMPEGNNQQTHR
jgi:hypothetical protein